MKIKSYKIEYEGGLFIVPVAGAEIDAVAFDAVYLAEQNKCPVRFVFNDVQLQAHPGQDHNEIIDLFHCRMGRKNKDKK